MRPLLLTMGKSIIETGMLGSGHAMKALNNYVSAAGLLAACEALKVGGDFGIAPDKIVAVLNASTGKNNSTENKLMQFIVSGQFNSGFSLGLMKKDINIATDLAKSLGAETLLGEVLLKSWADAEAKLSGAADHTEIYRMLESRAGRRKYGCRAARRRWFQGVTGVGIGSGSFLSAMTSRRTSGRSVISPSTPQSIRRAMSSVLFTVQGITCSPSSCACFTRSSLSSRK